MVEPTLDGEWLANAIARNGVMGPVLPDSTITVRFEGSNLSGFAGCNRFFGKIREGLVVAPISTTLMSGPPAIMDQERVLLGYLGSVARFSRKGEALSLESDGMAVATFSRFVMSITGKWTVVALNNGKGGVAGALSGAAPVLEFGDDGTVAGLGGCNRFSASYHIVGRSLQISAVAATRKACPHEIMEQENRFFELLPRVRTVEHGPSRSGDRLTMYDEEGRTLIQLALNP